MANPFIEKHHINEIRKRQHRTMMRHVRDLSALLNRMTPEDAGYERIRERLEEAKKGAKAYA